jgi:Tol biopolymer transport system component
MQKVIAVLILFTFLLAGCGTFEVYVETTPVGDSTLPLTISTPEPELSLDSTSEQIRQAMLESATKWKSIWMDGTITYQATEGSETQITTREQVWIDLTTSRFRVLSGPADGPAERFLTSDGLTILDMDLKTGQSQSRPMPEFARIGQYVPTPEPGYSYPQPLWGQIGTQLSQLAFSSDFAQSEGTFKPVAVEYVAGRQALVVDWIEAGHDLPAWRMWLDGRTAVILKMQSFLNGSAETVYSESVVDQVVFDDVFANSLFGIPAALPQFSDIRGQGSEPVETGADAPSGRDALGELYFFTVPLNTGQSVSLVRMPGLCVTGKAECPQLERIETPFPFNFTLNALSWSPDGNFAAFGYPDNTDGTPQKLWLFDPAAKTWTSLFEYAYIDPPFWSPDGEWIAFRVQDGLGGEDVYAVRRDGSEPKNLTATNDLPAEGRPYVMTGWITGNIVVRSGKPGNEGMVYLVRVADGRVQPMFETLLTKAVFIPSPDGTWLAYDDYDYTSTKHALKVAEPDGDNVVELASFTGGSLFPIVWSPDSRRLAFTYYTEITQGTQTADVYVIDRDGKGLKQVYRGNVVGSILFSPDGNHMVVSESSSPTGSRLFVINLDTLEQRLLQSPGLTLDSDWYMPSWRK